jgi:rare lipoprotein A (peptidoglycan hydrolase)
VLRFSHPFSRAVSLVSMLALCGALVLGSTATAQATSLGDAQAKAAEARAKLDIMRGRLASGMSAYAGAANDLAHTRAEIADNNQHLAKVRSSLVTGQHSLNTQAEFLYRTDGTGFVDVLLGSATFDQFASRLSVLTEIASKDANLVLSLKGDRAEMARILGTLKDREARQKALVGKIGAQRAIVQASLDQQQAYTNSLSSDVASILAAQEKAASAARARTAVSTRSSSSSSSGGKTPSASHGSVSLKQATVAGRSGSWWVMASESSAYRPTGVTFSGEASEYGTNDNGTGTSSGRPLNDSELTCAHPSLGFGTRIAVTHGSRRVIVVVTDRGPYSGGRVIDLTHRAAGLLGLDGVGQVKCEVVQSQ